MDILLGAAVVVFLSVAFTVFFGAPYVPSRRREIRQAFTNLYPLSHTDTVVDLGSGDGVVLRIAREFGAKAVGYELSPPLAWLSRALAGGDTGQAIINQSYWGADFPQHTTVVYAFSDRRDIQKIHALTQKQADRLGKPLALMTYGFEHTYKKPVKTQGAYFLYNITPCGNGQA